MTDTGLPRLLAALLRLRLGGDWLEFVLGDLEEEFQRRRRLGGTAASVWLWRQGLACLLRPPPRLGHRASKPRGDGSMHSIAHDVLYAARVLRKSPGFTLTVLLTLALGVGAATAIFGVVDAVMLRPLPYPNADRLVSFFYTFRSGAIAPGAVSPVMFAFWKEHSEIFEALAVTGGGDFNFVSDAGAQRARGLRVSDDFFHVLGVQPAIGRAFLDGEQQPNGPRVAILSHGLWQRAMGGRMDAIDRQITLNDRDYTVVGVMPGDFTYEPQPDVIVPLQMAVNPANIGLNYTILGLLAPNLTVESAQPDMERVFQQYQSENPGHLSKQMVGASVGLVQDHLTAPYRPVFTILLAAAGLVLLIVCANVTNLLLSRGAVRHREMAIRTALGASRGRLVGHVMAESLLLALAGGVCSLLLAFWGVRVLLALSPSGIPRLASVGLDGRVLLFAAVVSVVSGLACGAMGSLRLVRTGPGEALKASASTGGPDRSRQRLSSALVVAEVAISAILLTGAALLIVTYFNLRSLRPGFDPENLLVVEYPLTSQRYATAERIVGFESSLLEEVRALPGVLSATAASGLPFQRGLNHVAVIEGRADEEWQLIEYRAVGPEYFSTLGIPVLQGRGIEASDIAAGPPVVVVNQRMARIIDGGPGALGARITIGKRTSSTDVTRDVVGVVADIADGPPGVPALPTVYVPRGQSRMLGSRSFSATLIRVRPFADVAASVRHAIGALDPTLPIVSIRPLSEVAAAALAPQRFNMTLIGAFAGAALLLTIVGLYGLLSYGVTQRTREIGLRVALGAARGRVVGMVLRRGMTLSLAGTVLGVAGALGLSRFMSSLLFGVSGTSFTVFAAVVIALLGLAMMATLVPAVRATRIEPNVALRTD